MIDELSKLNETWMRAWFAKDAAAVERMTSDDYVYVAPSGQVMDRQAILAIIRSPGYSLDHGARSEVVVRPLGEDSALVRHRWKGGGRFEGKTFEEDQRGVMVCVRAGGEWQVVFEQCGFSGAVKDD